MYESACRDGSEPSAHLGERVLRRVVWRRDRSAAWKRHRARWPAVTGWAGGLLLCAAGLLGLAFLIGNGRARSSDAFLAALDATAEIPGVALTLAFLLAVASGWCCRHILLEWLAWWPGRLEVRELVAEGDLDIDLTDLTTRFRARLAKLRLLGKDATAVPGVAPAGDFIDVLQRGGVDPQNLWATVLNLLRAAIPSHAYELRVVAFDRPGSPRSHGITVHVAGAPSAADAPLTIVDTSWYGAVDRAADAVTASILPRTRRCQRPWTAWRRFVMDPALLHSFERGMELEEALRYDEALECYHRALRLDPMNLGVRLQLGMLEERLGLFLDALATYTSMLAITQPAGQARLPRGLYRRKARWARRRILLIARYRRAVLVAGHGVAEQWRRYLERPDVELRTRRDDQRKRIRELLAPLLKRELGASAAERVVAADREVTDLLSEPERSTCGDHEIESGLRELLQLFACAELADLRRRVRWAVVKRPWDRWRRPISPKAIKLSEACVDRRLEITRGETPNAGDGFVAERDREVQQIGGVLGFRQWQEHYNAACVFALPLLSDSQDDGLRDELAKRAVRQLELGAATADSAFIASRRHWLISEDPDLNGLRPHAAFKGFESVYLPSAAPTPTRPSLAHEWEMSRHSRDLLVAAAERWEAEWHRRGAELPGRPDIHVMLEWWKDEFAAWSRVRELAVEHRHWETRAGFVAAMAEWASQYGFEVLEIPFRRYSDPVYKSPGDMETVIEGSDARFWRLADALPMKDSDPEGPCSLLDELEGWQSVLRELDLSGSCIPYVHVARLCDAHAGLWGRLQEWLNQDLAPDEAARQRDTELRTEFQNRITDTRQLWREAQARWRAGDAAQRRPRRSRNGASADQSSSATLRRAMRPAAP